MPVDAHPSEGANGNRSRHVNPLRVAEPRGSMERSGTGVRRQRMSGTTAVFSAVNNADPSIVGRTIDIDRQPWTIIGVAPKDFRGLTGQADLLPPATTLPLARLGPTFYNFVIIGRRAPGVTVAQASAPPRANR